MNEFEPIEGWTIEESTAIYAFLSGIALQVEEEIKAEYGEYLERAENIEEVEE